MSYFEAEIEMLKYRLPQPSNKPKTVKWIKWVPDDRFALLVHEALKW
jgi:hypothetical protein